MLSRQGTAIDLFLYWGNQVFLESFDHVAIICSDYQRSKEFYTEVLGLTIIAENYREERQSYKLDLALPNGNQIELFSFPEPPVRPSQPEARGLRHLAFVVASVEEMSSTCSRKELMSRRFVLTSTPVRNSPFLRTRMVFH